jgi:hypothetical protein
MLGNMKIVFFLLVKVTRIDYLCCMKVIKVDKNRIDVCLFHSKLAASVYAGMGRMTFNRAFDGNGVYSNDECYYVLVNNDNEVKTKRRK